MPSQTDCVYSNSDAVRNVKTLTGTGTTTVLFIRHVSAVVVTVTHVTGWDTSAVSALELARTACLGCIQSRTALNLIDD